MSNRQTAIFEILYKAEVPVSASDLARQLNVSRQSIVGDIALLRASGTDITATSKGYVLTDRVFGDHQYVGTVVCNHSDERLKEELYTIVDMGGVVIDVSIEHAIYGELTGRLELSSRYDVDLYLAKVSENINAAPISRLTGGKHMHRIGCKDREIFERIRQTLCDAGIAR
ncbi:MAG: transcription repressor NadR [Firmicutes bacterium]|nr:transcription repressor NadR [Bacillota bacterium]